MGFAVILLLIFGGSLLWFIGRALATSTKIGGKDKYTMTEFTCRFVFYTLTFDFIFWMYWSEMAIQFGSDFVIVLMLLTHLLAGYFYGVKVVNADNKGILHIHPGYLAICILCFHIFVPYLIYWSSFGRQLSAAMFYLISLILFLDTLLGYYVGKKSELAKYARHAQKMKVKKNQSGPKKRAIPLPTSVPLDPGYAAKGNIHDDHIKYRK